MKLGDILPRQADNLEEKTRKAEGKVADLEGERTAAQAEVERLTREATTRESEALDHTTELVEKLKNAGDGEVYDLRLKLRAELRRLIRNIVVLVVQVNRDPRHAKLQVA